MASTFTLDDIRDAAETKYGATKIDLGDKGVVELRNAIRLSKEERKAFKELKFFKDKEEGEDEEELEDEDVFEQLAEVVRILATSEERANCLLDSIGVGRVDLLAEIVNTYMEDQKAGKASASQD